MTTSPIQLNAVVPHSPYAKSIAEDVAADLIKEYELIIEDGESSIEALMWSLVQTDLLDLPSALAGFAHRVINTHEACRQEQLSDHDGTALPTHAPPRIDVLSDAEERDYLNAVLAAGPPASP